MGKFCVARGILVITYPEVFECCLEHTPPWETLLGPLCMGFHNVSLHWILLFHKRGHWGSRCLNCFAYVTFQLQLSKQQVAYRIVLAFLGTCPGALRSYLYCSHLYRLNSPTPPVNVMKIHYVNPCVYGASISSPK